MGKSKYSKIDLSENLRKLILIFLSIEVISLSFSIAVSSIAFAIAVTLWVAKLTIEKKWIKTPVDIFFLLFIFAEILSTILSLNSIQSIQNMKRVLIFTVFYMSFQSFSTERELKKFFVVFWGFIGFLSIIEIILKYIFQIDRIGVFQHYMTTGGIKMVVCLMIIPFLFQKGLEKKVRIFLVVIFIPIFLTLILTMTRSSWYAFVLGIVIYSIIKNRYTLIFLFVFILLFALVAPNNYKERALSGFDPTLEQNKPRINMIVTGWRIFQDYPFFGVGDIDFKKIYLQYTVPLEPNEGGHLHNNLIQILVGFGIFGFLIYLSLFTILFIYLIKNYLIVKSIPILSSLALAPIMIFAGFHLNGLFEWNFGDQEIAILFWFSMSLSVIAKKFFELHQSAKKFESVV